MIQEGTDWMNDMLKFMYKHYTAWDVPLNTYLQAVFNGDNFPRTDSQKFGAISTVLAELQRAGLITYTISEPPQRFGEGTPFSFESHNLSARLTFQGLTYIQGYNQNKNQEKIERQNKVITIIGIVIAVITGFFVALTGIHDYREKEDEELKGIKMELNNHNSAIQSLNENIHSYLDKTSKQVNDTTKPVNLKNKNPR